MKNDPSRYLRQMVLPDFGDNSQSKLAQANVLVIGCGGLGAPVIQYLAAAGVGKLSLCDDDHIEITNLNRQVLFNQNDVGKLKAEQAVEFVKKLNSDVQVEHITERITCYNIASFLINRTCILDCTDGLSTKFLLNDAAVLAKSVLIHGSAIGYQGRLMVIKPQSACLRCFFPEKPNLADMPTCSTMGILGPVCGIIGSLMATETLKLLTDNYHSSTTQYLLINTERKIQIKQFDVEKDSECLVCSEKSTIKQLLPNQYQFTCEA